MRRRRKYWRGYKKSTNVIKMKFQSFMDISTNDSSMQIITISAGGEDILRRLAPQFGAYKYYKIGNISVKLVPASTLPVDPTGLSITAGDNLVDPRDQLTPGMMRITNGEDVFEDISGLSDTAQHQIYNNMLLDPRWFKWMLQSGVKRHAIPRYWQIGQLHQDKWPGSVVNFPVTNSITGGLEGTGTMENSATKGVGMDTTTTINMTQSSPYGMFQTGHRGVLGWLPTDGLSHVFVSKESNFVDMPLLASPPEVEVMKIILPKAYKTRYWYRAFITETVYFKEPIVNFGVGDAINGYYRPIDVFHSVYAPQPVLPSDNVAINIDDTKTGGNYGDD